MQKSLLVVEDEVLVARDIKSRLTKMGYEVLGIASKGREAIDMALDLRPDLILMDINLRDDIDGVEAAIRIKQDFDVPIIFCTAYSNEETLERAKISEPYGYVLKPFDNRELEINIEIALFKHRTERDLSDTRKKMHATLSNISDAVIATDLTGQIELFNPTAERITGWCRTRARGRRIDRIINILPFNLEDTPLTLEELAARDGLSDLERYRIRPAEGPDIPVELSVNVIVEDAHELMVITFRDITQQLDYEEKLLRSAFFDDLTELPNRSLFIDRLESSINRRKRGNETKFAVLFIDIDGFAVINEGLGHEHGDQLIKEVGRRIAHTIRPDDTVARYSGDIFGVLLDPVDSVRGALQACARIQKAVNEPFQLGDNSVNISLSAGIVLNNNDYESPHDMMRDADNALHRAKLNAKGSYMVFDNEMYANALRFIEWKSGLQQAIQDDAFDVYYQPIVCPESGDTVSFEALVRWEHPEHGFVSPAEFIPVAEETGLILPIGELVLRSVCHQIREWSDQGISNFKVAVNLSARQFESNIAELVTDIVREAGISPQSLALEITEGIAMKNVDDNIRALEDLRHLGLSISIDDFGTGYSSLAYLKRFPLNTLKIDRSFIMDISTNPDDLAITCAIIAMGQNLRLKVLAEGVETSEQLALLREQGIDYIQGYYYSKPLPSADVIPYLRANGDISSPPGKAEIMAAKRVQEALELR